MENIFSRTQKLIGKDNLSILQNSSVAVFGIGGVGGFALEALCRSGIGSLTIFDYDVVSESNLNRQIIATKNTLDKLKVEVAKERILSINPNLKVQCYNAFILPENLGDYDFLGYDYIIDAVDTVSTKLALIEKAQKQEVPIISCMGTGGKTEVNLLKVASIWQTSGCPLARVMRREAKARGLKDFKVVYSEEIAKNCQPEGEKENSKKKSPPSMIFVPATAGIMLASEVVKDLLKLNK